MSLSRDALAPSTTSALPRSIIKLCLLLIAQLPLLRASPLGLRSLIQYAASGGITTMEDGGEEPVPAESPTLWIYLSVAIALVLLGGAFAGLTIALMGQDEIYLQVIKTSGEGAERRHADKVLRLLKRGKHWVLVTLLLGNVITNETLPIVLDRSLGGGWPAVLGSTVLIVIFGEVIPQSICVRYGLPIGAWMSPLVLILMYILAPVAWPTAKLLDTLLGEDHGTTYKKAGLKTLVTLHKSLGAAGEQLNQDEVTIISAVLDLKAKPVGSIMTPMDDVFTMSADTVLDEKTMEVILGAGYSRIPIYAPENEKNFIGMLLVKILITYDPEDCKRVRDFALATLPETRAETSCLDIVNFFQEGKSHMVLVSEYPGEDHGALGVVTLEDVIEELIGEEIIDESDVFIDVHKAIRRITPAPKSRVPKGEVITEPEDTIADGEENELGLEDNDRDHQHTMQRTPTSDAPIVKLNGTQPEELGSPPRQASFTRRRSSQTHLPDKDGGPKKPMNPELREHLKHLGPSNLASRPRTTRYNTVKIKPGSGTFADGAKATEVSETLPPGATLAPPSGNNTSIINSAGRDAKDGVLAVQAGYGSIPSAAPPSPKNSRQGRLVEHAERESRKSQSSILKPAALVSSPTNSDSITSSRSNSHSTINSLNSDPQHKQPRRPTKKRATARSGSITENIIDTGTGFKKTVLEMTSSNETDDDVTGDTATPTSRQDRSNESSARQQHKENLDPVGGASKKKRSRRKGHGQKKTQGADGAETQPLLGHH